MFHDVPVCATTGQSSPLLRHREGFQRKGGGVRRISESGAVRLWKDGARNVQARTGGAIEGSRTCMTGLKNAVIRRENNRL